MGKRKIAILGGGMSGLAAAYELTKTPELRERHEVTIYQMGWRLGGKCASGRNFDPQYGRRIEEHGLHVWFGFYENAFELLRDAYDHLSPAPTEAIRTWKQAVRKQSVTPIGVLEAKPWELVSVEWPENGDEPGDGRLLLTPWGAITEIISLFERVLRAVVHQLPTLSTVEYVVEHTLVSLLSTLIPSGHRAPSPEPHLASVGNLIGGLDLARQSAAALRADPARATREHANGIVDILRGILVELQRLVLAVFQRPDSNPMVTLALEALEIGTAMIAGIVSPKWGVLEHFDLERVDHFELREWLVECGCSNDVAYHGNALRAFYDTAFAYEDGSRYRPNMAAGTATRALLRIVGTYKGAVLYLLEAGMGETVVSPIYRVLRDRGVKLELFHKVEKLELTSTKNWVEKVHFTIQAQPKTTYEPITFVDGLWCWPTEPFWDQLENGDELRTRCLDANFESWWCDVGVGQKTIELGTDFDDVVLAIPLGAFKRLNDDPTMLDELYAVSPALRSMQEAIGLVPSQSLQLWTRGTLRELGYPNDKPAAVGAPEYLSIWADMSQQLRHEGWAADGPRSIQYWCGVLPTDLYRAKKSDKTVPKRARALVREEAERWLSAYGAQVWPAAAKRGIATDATLYAMPRPDDVVIPAIDTQYVRQNVDPTECCVLSPKGTTELRLGPADSGFVNLWLAGDWTRTGMNTASVEGAVMSGKAVSRAMCGSPKRIVGEDFFRKASGGSRPTEAEPRATTVSSIVGAVTSPVVAVGTAVRLPAADLPSSSGLPAYVSDHGHGEQCSLPPGMIQDARVSCFSVGANATVLQATVDRFLNAPTGGQVHYSVLSVPFLDAAPVMFSFTSARRLYSVPEVTGWVPDHEFAAWVILARHVPGRLLPQIVFWNPYILLDTFTGAITGREIWGFRKQLAQVKAPPIGGPEGPLVFEVSALTFETFSQETRGTYRPLAWIDGVSTSGGHRVGTCEEVTEALIETIAGSEGHVLPKIAGASGFHLRQELDLGRVRITNLKQFRDAVDPTKACYQAIVEALCVPKKIHGFGLYTGGTIGIADVASHRMVQDLGLPGHRVPIVAGMYVDFDFTAEPGEVLWESLRRR